MGQLFPYLILTCAWVSHLRVGARAGRNQCLLKEELSPHCVSSGALYQVDAGSIL
jgi:hypothetical protein